MTREFQTKSLPRAAFVEIVSGTDSSVRFDDCGNALFVFSLTGAVADAARQYDEDAVVSARQFSHRVGALRDRLFAAKKQGIQEKESMSNDYKQHVSTAR